MRNRAVAESLALTCYEYSQGNKTFQEIEECYHQFESLKPIQEIELPFADDSLENIYNTMFKKPGLRWRMKSLNQSLGSLRKGDFGFIFARPETGKTSFLASEITYMAQQAESPILWFNNEERGSKVILRNYQAALGVTLTELLSDRRRCETKYREATKGNIRLIDSASIHRREVEKLVERLSPALVIFDQIDKIKGFDADREDLRLGSIYIWNRELAKGYCPSIGVCQADGTAEGERWLNMNHVANAKTSKQAEADWILGIGKTHDPNLEYIRHFNISKNKLTGDEDSIPELRHARWDVIFEPAIARYRDILQ